MTALLALLVVGQTGLDTYRDLEYAFHGGISLKLDLYVPRNATKAPLVVWIHGGGWQSGNKTNFQPARILQQRHPEFAVASIDYRLSGQAIWPAQMVDCKTAVAWLRARASQYRLDSDRFAVWGSSAGGHLAAIVGTTNDWPGVDTTTLKLSRVQAVCDYYGPTDFLALAQTPGYESHGLANSAESRLIGGAVNDNPALVAAANPITYVSSDDPPFFIVHGTADPVVAPGQSLLLHQAPQAHRVQTSHQELVGAGHGGAQFTEASLIDKVHRFFVKAFSK